MQRIPRVVAVALVAVVLAACGGPPPGDTLAPDAFTAEAATSPEDVVRAYLGALQEDDQAVATSLTTDPYADGDVWAEDPPTIEDVTVSAASPDSTRGTAGEGHAEAVVVQVTFTLHGADETMQDGPTRWGYVLVRDSATGPWRIAGAGNA